MRRGQKNGPPTSRLRRIKKDGEMKEKIMGIIVRNTDSVLLRREVEKMAEEILEAIIEEVEEKMSASAPAYAKATADKPATADVPEGDVDELYQVGKEIGEKIKQNYTAEHERNMQAAKAFKGGA